STKGWCTARCVPSDEGRSVITELKPSRARGTLPTISLSSLMGLSAAVEHTKTAHAASSPSTFPESYLDGAILGTSSQLKRQPMRWCFTSNAALCSLLPRATVELQVFYWRLRRTSFDVPRSTRY